jgi:hypothetical protein
MHPGRFAHALGILDLILMRCLVVADLHYSLPQFDWLLAAAPEFDVVIFAGDALDIGSSVDFRAQIVVVKSHHCRSHPLISVRAITISTSAARRADRIWIGDVRELGIARDGDSLTIGTRFTQSPGKVAGQSRISHF